MSKSNKKNPKLTAEEKLRMENEIEKLKLSASHGAEFFSDKDIPPEIESQWLKNIKQFEEQFENAEQTTVAKRLGNPDFPSAEQLTENEVEENLDKVRNLMAENGLYIDAIAEVSSAEMYRFITEELFLEEIDDIRIDGLATNFIYEEFYPNNKLDIEHTLTGFIREMLSDDFRDYLDLHLADTCKTKGGKSLSKEEAANKAYAYGDLYDKFTMENIGELQINIDEHEQEAWVSFPLSYKAGTGNDATQFKGEVKSLLKKGKLGYWNIVEFDMPGFSL